MPPETLKEKARDALLAATEKEQGVQFSPLNQKQQSIAAARFYMREIHNPQKTAIEEDDILEGTVDGANDLGCDFINRDDGHVVIVQGKYRKANGPESQSEISHFQSILKRFRNPEFNPNKYLKAALAEINWDTDTFELIFLTFGRLEGQARLLTAQEPDYPTDVLLEDERLRFVRDDLAEDTARRERSKSLRQASTIC